AAHAPRRATAVHGGVTHADDEHALADGLDVAKGHGLEPLDADVDVSTGVVVAPGQFQLLALGRADAHEDGVEVLGEEIAHGIDRRVVVNLSAHVDDYLGLGVEYLGGQTELGDVGSHEAAGRVVLLENG